MLIILEPTVTLLAQPHFTAHPKYQLPPDGNPAERLIATAGKVCYDSYGLDGNPVVQHIRNLVGSGHHSVLEHVHVSLFIEGISRGCSHEIVRHRVLNFSQRSTRFTAEDDAAIVLDPYYAKICTSIDATPAERTLLDRFIASFERSLLDYADQVERLTQLNPNGLAGRDLRKWCRGKARQLLPHALETRMVMTGNLRAWRHFLLMRTSRHAEAEIRRLAQGIWGVLEVIAPTVYADLKRETVEGFMELSE